jgi:predicted DNA-binding protein (MmcQ/YjbR family)
MIDLESKIFERSHVDVQRLLEYGFQQTSEGYRYSVDILDKEFRVELSVSIAGKLQGQVFETLTGDAYRNIWIEGMTGAFVGKVREAYGQVLQAVRQHGYIDDDFSTPQANRISGLIQGKYGAHPEFLWKRMPQHGVFRNQQNQKWFGIIMYVERDKITAGEGKIDVLNVKVSPEDREALWGATGIYPAYHLNKKNWISILLDDSVPDAKIIQLVAGSYRIVQQEGKKPRHGSAVQEWLIPANPRYFNVEEAFREQQEIIWKQSTSVAVDDIVFLYVTAPVSTIRYQCLVTAVDIPYEYESRQIKIQRVMRIKLLKKYDENLYTLQWLQEHGIKMVRGPMRINHVAFSV